ncbi:hypothetical protein MNB_SV-5-356 [hydrothermal vent metagenome]|uniref:DAGKc domain-containing protein n=1 Tax=hydrothermal vent metagenome TaxID=652676 RepID=A0A1W1EFA3_9ZZZZ
MKILSIGKVLKHDSLDITSIKLSALIEHENIEEYHYIIINGGDGTIRRVLKHICNLQHIPIFILNPTGSFNVIAKIHKSPKIDYVLDKLSKKESLKIDKHDYFKLNNEIFLFSAGNIGDLQHILLSETFRFGWLKDGALKYILAFILLLPTHLIMTPFMLFNKRKFFIFTPMSFIKKIGNFYGKVPNQLDIDLDNEYNMMELDGDIVTIKEQYITIKKLGKLQIVSQ